MSNDDSELRAHAALAACLDGPDGDPRTLAAAVQQIDIASAHCADGEMRIWFDAARWCCVREAVDAPLLKRPRVDAMATMPTDAMIAFARKLREADRAH